MKKQVYLLMSVSKEKGTVSWYLDMFIVTLISLNVLVVVLESVESIRRQYEEILYGFEVFSVIIFSIEYVLRLWSINIDEKYNKPVIGNLRYAITPMAIVDLMAVLPFYLPLLGVDFIIIRVLRLFRLFRLFKIARYVKAISIINNVFKEKREELVISVVFTFFMLLVTSTAMYHLEHEAQPQHFSSIPQTMWWGIATLTTVGYGDVYPVTGLGKFLGGIIAVLGVGLFALPTGILASGFSDQIGKRKSNTNKCPHCPHCNAMLEDEELSEDVSAKG